MPTYQITAPNGKSYRIEGPAGASDEQIRAEVLRQFPDADPTLKQHPDTVRGPDIVDQPAGGPQPAGMDVIAKGLPLQQGRAAEQNALASIVEGVVAAPYDMLANAASGVNQGVNYAITEGGGALLNSLGADSLATGLRGAGRQSRNALANMGGTATEAIERISPTPKGMEAARFTGQLVSSLMAPLGPKRMPSLPKAPKPASTNPAHQIVRDGEANKVRVMTSDVRQPDSFTGKVARAAGERVPYAGTGGPRVAQQAERVEAVKVLARDFGVEGAEEVLGEVADDLAKTRGGRLSFLVARKNRVIEGIKRPFTEAPKTIAAIDEQIAKLRGIDSEAYAPVIARLEQFKKNLGGDASGALDEFMAEGNERFLTYTSRNGEIADIHLIIGKDGRAEIAVNANAKFKNNQFGPGEIRRVQAQLRSKYPEIKTFFGVRETGAGVGRTQTVAARGWAPEGKTLAQVEGQRRLLGDLFADPNLASIKGDGQKAINAIYGPLRDDMGAFIKRNSGDEAFNAWKKSNDELSAMAGELDARAFKSVLNDADTTPENVAKLLFSKKPSDVRRLFANLSPAGQEKAKAAVLHHAIEKGGGLEDISPQKFATALEQFGKTTGIIFGDDAPRIEGIVRLLKATQQASVAAAAPPTGVQNTQIIGAAVLTDMLGSAGAAVTAGTIAGLAARLYESAPVRNLLISLSKTPPGSKAEGALLQRIGKTLAAQAEIQAGRAASNDNVRFPTEIAADPERD